MNLFSDHLATLHQLIRLPVARLRFDPVFAPAQVLATYRHFTKRHPKYKLIQNKSWGAALIDLGQCATRAEYFERIKGKNNGAWHAKRALARGYVVQPIDRNDHVDAIHAIHLSQGERQGRPMDARYLERQCAFDEPPNIECYGVFNGTGRLMAYATIGRYGNFSAFSQLMGLRNNDGIMHLMVSEIVARLIDEGAVSYVMYDTFFGALPGMRQFKTVLGFHPYRAKYSMP